MRAHTLIAGAAGEDLFDIDAASDPDVQRQRLEAQSGEETQKIDYDFIETLECGMPPAGGLGIGLGRGLGLERLCMMLTGAPTIRDVVLFPLLKRKG